MKKDALDRSCFTFRLHSCPNFLEADRNLFIIFGLGLFNEARRRRMRNYVARISFVNLYTLYRCRYINLINLYRILLGTFHHQDLFSLNLDRGYGGIKLGMGGAVWTGG